MDRRVVLNDINPHLLCVLCGGYLIDATTISDCLHSFCRSCIVKHLENNKFCPICDVQLHKTKPLLSIRPDKILQRLVYKVVEGLHKSEYQRRQQFYQSQETTERSRTDRERDLERVANYHFYKPEDPISLSLEYYDSLKMDAESEGVAIDNIQDSHRRYLQCPAGLSVKHIQKFLRMKYQLSCDHRVDVYYKHKLLREHSSLGEVADMYDYDRVKPMRLFFQLLERQAVTVMNTSRVTVTESPPSTSVEATILPPTSGKASSGSQHDQTVQSDNVTLGKKKLKDNPHVETLSPPKKLRIDQKEERRYQTETFRNNQHPGNQTPRRTNNIRSQEVMEDVSKQSCRKMACEDPLNEDSQESTTALADAECMDTETVSQTAESIDDDNMGQDASQDIEEVVVDIEGESSQDFILQDQQIDMNEDLEEDDDEDRLRICDPEEVIEDKASSEVQEEIVAEPAEKEEEKLDNYIEEEVEVVRKESKSRKKNKKAKHHHRHKRDYSPAPEAQIVSDDKNDIMKLKVKITRPDSESNGIKNKHDDSKHKNNESQRQSKHKTIVIQDDNDNNSVQSLSNSNMDEDSRNSQSTEDHDARSITSSKEGQDEIYAKEISTHNGTVESSKAKNIQVSNKEKLLQMRQVRHKNITPPPRPTTNNTTITKVSSEEAARNSPKAPIVLTTPNSSVTVSKVTAEEKLKMMTNNNLEMTQPSLEIIPVNKSNLLSKTIENKSLENHYKHHKGILDSPVVRLTKSNSINALANKQHQSLSVTKINDSKVAKDDKKPRPGEKRSDSVGVLDLSKPVRSTSASPASEGSCPSPNHSSLSMAQPMINRHLSSVSSPHRASSNSPPVPNPVPKSMQFPHSMYNLMALSNAAVHIENKSLYAQQEAFKRQQQQANQKKPSPQRFPGMSPAKSPAHRASPTQLKIPNPGITLNNKFINRPKMPNNLQNNVRSVRPMSPVTARPINNSFGNSNMMSHSAAVAKKQAGINGRGSKIPPTPPGIPISELYKMREKYDLEKIARGLSAARKAAEGKVVAGIPSS